MLAKFDTLITDNNLTTITMSPQINQLIREFEAQLEDKRKRDDEVYAALLGDKYQALSPWNSNQSINNHN